MATEGTNKNHKANEEALIREREERNKADTEKTEHWKLSEREQRIIDSLCKM